MDVTGITLQAAARTPLAPVGGAYRGLTNIQLGALALSVAGERAKITAPDIKAIVLGSIFGAGIGPNPAQRAATEAGLSEDVVCLTTRAGFGSALAALLTAGAWLGDNERAIIGGMDSASTQPYLLPGARFGSKLGGGKLVDGAVADAYTGEDDVPLNVTSAMQAQRLGLDAAAVAAEVAATRATRRQLAELAPVEVIMRREVETVTEDAAPGAAPNPWMAPLADGAAALVIGRGGEGVRLKDWVWAGCEPNHSPLAPVAALEALLAKGGWSASDLSCVELDDSLGLASRAAATKLALEPERINIYGGALELGAPGAASSAVALVHLEAALRERGGLGAIAFGTSAGGALALAFEA